MNRMLKSFAKYVSIGMINTAIHWVVFFIAYKFSREQSISNLAGFCVAVTFSFFANARWTFNSNATTFRYVAFAAFMGLLSWTVGVGADFARIPPLVTLAIFSAISLVMGFAYSNYFVFRGDGK